MRFNNNNLPLLTDDDINDSTYIPGSGVNDGHFKASSFAKRSVQDNVLSRISEVSNIAWEGSFVVPAGSTNRGFNVTSGFLFPSGKRLVMCCTENCKSVQMWTSSWANALYTTTAGNTKTMTPVANAEIMNLVFKNESASDVTEYVKFVYYDDVTIIGNAAKIRLMDTRVGNIETKDTKQDSDISNLQADVLKLDATTSENANFIKERTNVLINKSMMVSGKGVKTWESMSNIKMNDPSTYLYNDATNVISEIVPVKQGDILKLVWYDYIAATSFKYLLFDSNGDGYEFGTSSGAYRTKTIAIDGFIMFYAANAANFPPCVAVVSDEKEWVDARTPLYWDKHDKNPYPPNENPLEIIRSDAGYFPIFRSMGIVGDSLSCGAVEGTLDGNFVCPEFKDNSSAAVIKRITGVPATYFAKGGAYLHDNNWQNQFASAVASNPCDMYIIAIGYNDQGWVRDENKLGTIADINDADPSQNADSFYGYYGKMVQTILNAQPRAKLFFVTCPFYEWSVQSWNISINNAIREMCTKYNGFLIDLATYYLFPFYGVPDVRRSGALHLNTIGYYEVGIVMLSYINYIIRHNKEKFVDVSLIGTDIVIAPLVE